MNICIVDKHLNKVTMKNKYPIPCTDDLFDQILRVAVFSKADLRFNNHHISIQAEESLKTTFEIHYGHYEFQVVYFGLTNAPYAFYGFDELISQALF